MRAWLYGVPLAGLVMVGVITAVQLADPEKPGFVESVNRPAPDRVFDRLRGPGGLNFASPPQQQSVIVNLFASWCGPCRAEHPVLEQLADANPGRVFGIAYKDRPAATLQFLSELGDPYADIGQDPDGMGGLDFGLTGVPETFVIDAEGEIILHVRGPLSPDMVDELGAALGR